MFKRRVAAAMVGACFSCAPALAQEDGIARLREEIKQLQRSYEERMREIEKRLADAEARAAQAEQKAAAQTQTSASAASAEAASAPRTESTFNPGISLILQGTYARTKLDPDSFQIGGFMPSGGEVGPPKRSFGLGETELMFTTNIDPYFRGTAIMALTPENEVEVEEAYFQTLALPAGLTLKAGRLLSGIGYQNEIHQHAWDFQDAPLPYQAFFGGRYQQEGVQVRWLAPTPIFAELGLELGSGDAFPGNDRNRNGANSRALFGHVGGDIGTDYAWRAGVSFLRTGARSRSYEDLDSLGNPVSNSFDGSTRLWIVDGVLKWAPGGNSTQTNFKLQGEYFRARQKGTLTYDDTTQAAPQFGAAFTDGLRAAQSGWYGQAVWQFMPRWRVGYRYDRLDYGSVAIGIVDNGLGPSAADLPLLASHSPARNSAMIDFSPSEFSRFRLQFSRDNLRFGARDDVVLLQYIHSLGPHGAHRF
jgi:hypothetical protein